MATNNAVNTSLSGQTGTGTFVGDTSPTLVTPVLGAASATSLSFSSTSGIIGTTTNNSAAAGSVGQVISSIIGTGSAVSLTNSTPADITSISLTAGDWDVWGNVTFKSGATTVLSQIYAWQLSASASPPDGSQYTTNYYGSPGLTTNSGAFGFPVPSSTYQLAGTTTIYLSCLAVFTTDTLSACGQIFARRRR